MLNNKKFFILLIAFCLTALAAGGAEPSSNPNIVLVLIDTLRADHLSCYGHSKNTSPNIDALAQDAVRYDNCYSQAPWTTPSIASMMTSLYPSELQISDVPNLLQDRYVLLPEILQQNGYETGGIISHYFLGSVYNFNQGFDFFDEQAIFGTSGITSPAVTNIALNYLKHPGQKPFFLFVHYFDVHNDYMLHKSKLITTPPGYSGPLYPGVPLWQAKEMATNDHFTKEDTEYLRTLYESEIAYTDHHIGKLVDGLKQLDIYDNTLLIVCSDHGEEFMEHGFLGHSHTLYNEQLRVPLIVKYPHSAHKGVSQSPVALLDIAPTVLDTANILKPDDFRGISLLTSEQLSSQRDIFSETSRNTNLRSIIRRNIKMVYNVETKEYQGFDLKSDPIEKNHLPMQMRLYDMKLKLDHWVKEMRSKQGKGRNAQLSNNALKHLNSLGYTGGGRSQSEPVSTGRQVAPPH